MQRHRRSPAVLCAATAWKRAPDETWRWRACSIGTFALLIPACVILALLVAALVIVLPLLRFGLLRVALGLVYTGARPSWLGKAFRWSLQLDPWAMPDVLLFGCARLAR